MPISNKCAIQNNTLMQLGLIFHETFNKNKLKVLSNRLSRFSAIKKTVTVMEKGGGDNFALFLSLFLSRRINLQYELISNKGLFIVTLNLFSFFDLLIFSNLQFHHFFSLIFLYKFN